MSHEQYQRELHRRNSNHTELWSLLDEVKDPEIPVLSLWDMGILHDIQRDGDTIIVTITPTYSGCPAMDVIREDICAILQANGFKQCEVKTVLSPAWTTDWMTDKGRQQLRGYGIAAPDDVEGYEKCETPDKNVRCPHCESKNTKRVSEFGSTACKALFQCNDCCEPFDYFKNI
jgi:ring-1,2-phenylacetyl-CoA epoxidase subunit PaaD